MRCGVWPVAHSPRMNRLLAGLVALFLAAPAVAVAQVNLSNLPAGSVVGRSQLGTGPAQAIPFANLTTQLFGSLCKTSGAFGVYNSTTGLWVCSTASASSAHLGATADVYDFWIARPSATAGTILQMQDGKGGNLRTLTGANATGINFQSLVDTTIAGNTYAAISLDTQCQAGTGGSCTGINIVTQNNGTWTPGGGALPGAIAVEATGKSTRGGHVWGSDWTGWCLTVAAVECYGIEVNVRNDIAATAQASGIWLVNENSVVPTAGSGILISAQASNVGFPTAGFYFSTVAGFYPLTTGATLLKTDAATIATGIDLSPLTISGNAFVSPSFSVSGTGAVAAGTGAFNSFVSAGVTSALTGQLRLLGSTSGTAILTVPNAAGTPTLTIGSASGTPAVTASAPLAITAATGNITCTTCIVGPAITGYVAMTGTPDKGSTFATSTVTLAQLAGRVMQLQADLTTKGLIGP